MAESGVISSYLERLARELEFDPSLSRRVRREVEDHLQEAVTADPTADRMEAERRAVARFGSPREIAAQFTVVSLARRARRIGVGAVLVIGLVFIAMKGRLAWYAAMEGPTGGLGTLGQVVLSIDRYAFWLAVLVGLAGWLYIEGRRIPVAVEYRTQLRRFRLLCLTATGALIASVLSDGVLTSLRLADACWSSAMVLVPAASMAAEVLGAGGLALSLRSMARRSASTDRASRP